MPLPGVATRMLRPLPLALALLVAMPTLGAVASSGSLSFGAPVTVMSGAGEPSLAIGPNGELYAAGLAADSDKVAFSPDGGATWTPTAAVGFNAPWGGNDDHVAVGPDGTAYLVGQYVALGSVCMSVAQGVGGAFVTTAPAACAPPLASPAAWPTVDRPWLAVAPDDASRIYLFFTQPCCNGQQALYRSDDHGVTFALISHVQGYFPGGIVAGANGNVWIANYGVVYHSRDGGATWSMAWPPVNGGDYGLQHVGLARDAAGTLYYAFAGAAPGSSGATPQVLWTRSVDDGASWSAPVVVAPSAGTQVFPTIGAGSAGRVVVAWYESSSGGDPNGMPSGALWRARAAGTFEGGAASPAWSVASASPTMHKGVLCTMGAYCRAVNKNRDLLDFFTLRVDAQDRANVVYGNDYSASSTMFVRSS